MTKLRNLAGRGNKATAAERHEDDDFAFTRLNSLLTKLVAEGNGTLRPHFVWGVLHGAHLAKAFGINRISVIEFGVAGGNGLLSLERAAQKIEPLLDVGIDIYGFDTGAGLPRPRDYRDLPNLWSEGAFPLEFEKLKKRLTKAQLRLGLVEETVVKFIDSAPAPVAFISFDLDFYSSTMHAFKLLDAPSLLLPRIYCYFDDIMGFTYSEYTGERLAIAEFNASHPMRKISPVYGLKYYLPAPYDQAAWSEMFYIAHLFDHELYSSHDGLVRRFVGSGTDMK